MQLANFELIPAATIIDKVFSFKNDTTFSEEFDEYNIF